MGLEEDRLFIAMVVLAGLATVTLSAVVIFLSKQGLTEKERTSAALQGCFSDTASYIMEIGENAARHAGRPLKRYAACYPAELLGLPFELSV